MQSLNIIYLLSLRVFYLCVSLFVIFHTLFLMPQVTYLRFQRGRIVCFYGLRKNTGTGSKSSPAAILGPISSGTFYSAQNGGGHETDDYPRVVVSGFFLSLRRAFWAFDTNCFNFVASSKTKKM